MIEEIILGVALFLILMMLAVLLFVFVRTMARIERTSMRLRKAIAAQEQSFQKISELLSDMSTHLTSLGQLIFVVKQYHEEYRKEEQRREDERVSRYKEMAEAIRTIGVHSEALFKVAKAQIGATIAIEKTAAFYTKQAFGGGSPPSAAFTLEEENEIRSAMQRDGVSRMDAEIAVGEKRAEAHYDSFNIR